MSGFCLGLPGKWVATCSDRRKCSSFGSGSFIYLFLLQTSYFLSRNGLIKFIV